MEERVQLWVGVAVATLMYLGGLLYLPEQSLEVLSLASHFDVPHTSPQWLQLRDDCRRLWITVARAPACLLHGSRQIDGSSRMSIVENAQ